MAGISGHDPIMDVKAQLEGFQESDQRRNDFVQNLYEMYRELLDAHQRLQDDFINEQNSRRQWQDQAKVALTERDFLRINAENSCFALVLIDGDGAIFQNALLQAASEGGADAAHRLLNDINAHLQQVSPLSGNLDVIVHIYMNLDGLARRLTAFGIVKSPGDLHAFTRAFSMNQNLFSVVDVGVGKERADHKLKEMFRLFVRNQQCKHIVLGGISHDNGYLTNLEPFKKDVTMQKRISILETTPSEPGFLALKFNVFQCPGIFRSDKLQDKLPAVLPFPPATAHRQVSSGIHGVNGLNGFSGNHYNTVQVPFQSLVSQVPMLPPNYAYAQPQPQYQQAQFPHPHQVLSPIQAPSQSPIGTPIRPKTPTARVNGSSSVVPASPAPASVAPEPSSWATIGKKAANGEKNISIAPTPKKERRYMWLSAVDERLDRPIDSQKADSKALEARVRDHGRVCNEYHLTGSCVAINCMYDHGLPLTVGEKTSLRIKARQIPCPKLSNCRDINCYRGHHCLYGSSCGYGQLCKFVSTHSVDRTPVMKLYEDDTIDIISHAAS